MKHHLWPGWLDKRKGFWNKGSLPWIWEWAQERWEGLEGALLKKGGISTSLGSLEGVKIGRLGYQVQDILAPEQDSGAERGMVDRHITGVTQGWPCMAMDDLWMILNWARNLAFNLSTRRRNREHEWGNYDGNRIFVGWQWRIREGLGPRLKTLYKENLELLPKDNDGDGMVG